MSATKTTPKKASECESTQATLRQLNSREVRLASGRALREKLPRQHHATRKPSEKRRDPIDVLEESNRDRLPEPVVPSAVPEPSTAMLILLGAGVALVVIRRQSAWPFKVPLSYL